MTRWGVAISHEQALPFLRPEESELLPITLVCEDAWEAWAPAFGLGGQEMEH